LAAGDPIALDVHVVNDLRVPLAGVVVTAELSWPGRSDGGGSDGSGSERWSWTGDVPADSVVRVGTIQAVAPSADCRVVLSYQY
jgi:hypothetical protein